MEKFIEIMTKVGEWLAIEGVKLLIAVIALWVFCKVINLIFRKIDKSMITKKVDPGIRKLTLVWSKRAIKFIAFVCMLAYLGIETSGIAAAIASVGLTIGLALKGALSNFAGGIVLIIMRPFKVGDFIECNGNSGTVEEIELFYTYINTVDNRRIIIPNGKIINENITNYSVNKTRRDEIKFSISYKSNFVDAKSIIMNIMQSQEKILKTPEPFVNISSHNESSIELITRFWASTDDFWEMHWFMMEEVKKAFDANGIEIPYPQLDVHIKECKK